VNQNVLPSPTALVTPIVPAHQRDQLAGDREAEPGAGRSGAWSSRRPGANESKIVSWASGAMPMPVSATSKRRCSVRSLARCRRTLMATSP